MTAELLVELVGKIVWPVTVVILVLLFRFQLRGLMQKLGRLRYRDFEAEFSSITTTITAVSSEPPPESSAQLALPVPKEPGLFDDEKTRDKLREAALTEFEAELKVKLKRHVIFFNRADLHFDGSALKKETVYLLRTVQYSDVTRTVGLASRTR
jgi:hypothetical protein